MLVCFVEATALAATKITLLYTPVNSFVAGYVAKDQGLFEKGGLEVDLSLASNGSLISAALVADSAQIGCPTPTVLVQAAEQGLDLLGIAGTNGYPVRPGTEGVIARKDSGIKDFTDLSGKKVAVPGLGGINDVLLRKLIESKGIDYRQLKIVEIAFPQMADALKSGLVDAVSSNNPFYQRILDSDIGNAIGGITTIVPAGTTVAVYASTRSWVTKNADAVKAFRAALDEAVAFIDDATHKDAVQSSIAKWTKLPPQAVTTIAIPPNIDARLTPGALKFWIDVSREQGLIKGDPDPASLIAP